MVALWALKTSPEKHGFQLLCAVVVLMLAKVPQRNKKICLQLHIKFIVVPSV